MLGTLVLDWVGGEVDSTDIVTIDHWRGEVDSEALAEDGATSKLQLLHSQ